MAQIRETVYRSPYGFNPSQGQYIEQVRVGEGYAPGEATYSVEVSSFTRDELAFMLQVNPTHETRVEMRPGRNFGNIESEIRSAVNSIAGQAGIQAQVLLNQIRSLSPDIDVPTVEETLDVPLGQAEEWRRTINFPSITVPVPEGVSVVDQIDESKMPQIDITVTVQPNSWFHTWQEAFTFTIPPSALIEEVELSGDCGQLYSNISSRLNRLPNRVQGRLSGARGARSQLQDRADELGSMADVSVSSRISQAVNDIQNLSPQQLTGGNFASLKTQVEGIDTRFDQAQSLRDSVDDLRSEIEDRVGDSCISEFLSQLRDVEDSLSELETVSEEARELKNAILDALQNVESIDCGNAFSQIDNQLDNLEINVGVGTGASPSQLSLSGDRIDNLRSNVNSVESDIRSEVPSGSPCRAQLLSRADDIHSRLQQLQSEAIQQLGCGDISGSIRSAVNSVQSAVGTFTGKDQLARIPDRKQDLLSEVEGAINDVERNVDDRNPCKRQYLSRLRRTQSELQASAVRPETALPCEQRFQNVGNQLEQFEDQILSLSPPINPQSVQDIANQGEELADMIEEQVPTDDPCRSEMSQRVRALVERTRTLTPQIRIEIEGEQADEDRRQELINQLLDSIDRLQIVSGGGDTVEDAEEAVEEAVGDTNIPST